MICEEALLERSILIVEDDFLQAFDVKSALVKRGAKVIGPIGSLDEGLDRARGAPLIDAAVVDLNLGGEMAFPLVDELVRLDVPVILITGYDRRVIPYRLQHLQCIEKPACPTLLAEVTGELFAERVAG